MPIRFSVFPVGNLVWYTLDGAPTADELGAFLNSVLVHPRFRHGFAFLGDVVTEGGARTAFPAALTEEVHVRAAGLGPCKWAVVSSRTGAALPQELVSQVGAVGIELAAFPTMHDAMAWLADDTE